MNRAFPAAHHQIRGQILFDGHQVIQIGIPGKIGDAEATLPHHGANLVPVDLVPDRERNLGAVGGGQELGLDYKKQ